MSYILGLICADGSVVDNKRGGYYISISSADKYLVALFKNVTNAKHVISKRVSKTGRVFRIQIGSKEWFHDLGMLGIIPNKTKRLCIPKQIPKNMVSHFIRGYFDGDGNVWAGYVNKKRNNPTSVIFSAFTSCSLDFLKDISRVLKSKGIRGGGIYKPLKGNYYRLSFSTKDTLILYKFMYNEARSLCLERKRHIFEKYINLRV